MCMFMNLNEFNSNIIGQIEIVKVFAGENFDKSDNDKAIQFALSYL